MGIRKPDKEVLTETYCSYKGLHRLECASHWVDNETGEIVKIPVGLKAVYKHRLDNYQYFTKKGQKYNESHKRVADSLGLGLTSVETTYTDLLKRMGLLVIETLSFKNSIYTVYTLNEMRGWLINPKLKNYCKPVYNDYSISNKDKTFTYENLKNLEHNKRQAQQLKKRTDQKFYTVTIEQMNHYRELEKEKINNAG